MPWPLEDIAKTAAALSVIGGAVLGLYRYTVAPYLQQRRKAREDAMQRERTEHNQRAFTAFLGVRVKDHEARLNDHEKRLSRLEGREP